MTRILFCTSEVYPLSKTGGLGDLASALPAALRQLGHDVRIVTPGYRSLLARINEDRHTASRVRLPMQDDEVNIIQSQLPGNAVPVYVVDAASAFDRVGGLYVGPDKRDWPDNHKRFTTFCRAIVEIAMNRVALDWCPDVIHCNDWQTGLVPPLLDCESHRPDTLFVVNNLAYQGLFSHEQFQELGLPDNFWATDAMEFNGHFSFIKGGLVYADQIATVSPSYADEIKTPEFGYGLDGLLRHRAKKLIGIVNGIDDQLWDPAGDTFISHTYGPDNIGNKYQNKISLQQELGLPASRSTTLLSHIGRLDQQKGVDLIIAALPQIMAIDDLQLIILGEGDPNLEAQLNSAASTWPNRFVFRCEFSEMLAHRIEAGADIYLMPSRFEPCGLSQLYSMRYGTVPIIRRTGGLKDTVTCAHEHKPGNHTTGFCFDEATADALSVAITSTVKIHREQPAIWEEIMRQGMTKDFSWRKSAVAYNELYHRI